MSLTNFKLSNAAANACAGDSSHQGLLPLLASAVMNFYNGPQPPNPDTAIGAVSATVASAGSTSSGTVTLSGGSGTAATFTYNSGTGALTLAGAGAYTQLPANPVSITGSGGLTLNVVWGTGYSSAAPDKSGTASAAPASGGSNFAVGDILTVTSGTWVTPAQYRVASVSGGVVQTVTLYTPGCILTSSKPSNPVNTMVNAGTGGVTCTLTMNWVDTITNVYGSTTFAATATTDANGTMTLNTGTGGTVNTLVISDKPTWFRINQASTFATVADGSCGDNTYTSSISATTPPDGNTNTTNALYDCNIGTSNWVSGGSINATTGSISIPAH